MTARENRIPVILAPAPTPGPAVVAVLDGLPSHLLPDATSGRTAVVAARQPADGTDIAAIVARRLVGPGGSLPPVIRPPSGPTRLWLAPGGEGWVPLAISQPGARLARVLVPRPVARADRLVAAALVQTPAARPRSPVIGLWADFVHPRQGLPALLTGERTALLADLAAVFVPRLALVVLAVRLGPAWVAAATPDLIVAELVALALRAEASGDPEPVGPWQDPIVQRATELSLGVATPHQLRIVPAPAAGRPPGRSLLDNLIERLRLSLGVPSPPTAPSDPPPNDPC